MSTSQTRRRLRALLRSQTGFRQTMLATEVLQPPVAMRDRIRGPAPRTRSPRPAPQRSGVEH